MGKNLNVAQVRSEIDFKRVTFAYRVRNPGFVQLTVITVPTLSFANLSTAHTA